MQIYGVQKFKNIIFFSKFRIGFVHLHSQLLISASLMIFLAEFLIFPGFGFLL